MNKKVKWVGTLSTTERNHIGLIRVRQNNQNSEVFGFEITDGNGELYDLKNRKVLFCTYFDKLAPVEQYAEVIEDGKIVYTMNEHDMQKPVRINFAYFKIMDDKNNLVDTTQNFSYDIMPSIESKCINSEPYIIRLEEVLDAFNSVRDEAMKEMQQIIINFNEQVIKQQQDFEFWFESIRDILESVDPGGVILNELVDFRYSKMLDKHFNRMKDRGEFWDEEFKTRGYNVKWLCKSDGIADDTEKLREAIEKCKEMKTKLYIPGDAKIRITSTVDMTGIFIESFGEIIVDFNGIGIILGHISTQSHGRINLFRRVTHSNFKEGDISIRIEGSKYLEYKFWSLEKLQIFADGDNSTIDSSAYNLLTVNGYIKELEILSKKDALKNGWINENTFVKGKFGVITFDGNYHHNKNTFIDSCLEHSTITINKGSNNHFRTIRNESIKSVTFSEGTYRNSIEFSYYSSNGRLQWDGINDMGTGNIVYSVDDLAKTSKILDLNFMNAVDSTASVKENIEVKNGLFKVSAWKPFVKFELPATTFYSLTLAIKELYNRGFRYTISANNRENETIKDVECLIIQGSQFNKETGTYTVGSDVKNLFIINKSYKNFHKIVISIESSTELHVERLIIYAKAMNNKFDELELIKPIY